MRRVNRRNGSHFSVLDVALLLLEVLIEERSALCYNFTGVAWLGHFERALAAVGQQRPRALFNGRGTFSLGRLLGALAYRANYLH